MKIYLLEFERVKKDTLINVLRFIDEEDFNIDLKFKRDFKKLILEQVF